MDRRTFSKTCMMCTGLVLSNENILSGSTGKEKPDVKNIFKENDVWGIRRSSVDEKQNVA